jgi:hydroxymethylpyrimidine/phosphomethylpyrimidine kinase
MRPTVLVIGGSDSSGDAGIAQDLRVLAECGVGATLAITAVTAQTDDGVQAIHYVPSAVIQAQVTTALQSHPIRAIKIGMLGRRETVETLADSLPSRSDIPIVLDPVHISTSGTPLLDTRGWHALRDVLLPRVTLVTPNIPEAAALLGVLPAASEPEMITQGERIRCLGPTSVLMKGGHASGAEAVDLLILGAGDVRGFAANRLRASIRGTGCTLSTAIAAKLASEHTLTDACRFAKSYLFDRMCKTVASDYREQTQTQTE